MTDTEKAKAYDDAVNHAKKALDGLAEDYHCSHLTKDDIRYQYSRLFPNEDAFRDDEDSFACRKLIYGLKSLIQQGKETFAGVDIDDLIRYLEEKKEREPMIEPLKKATEQQPVANENDFVSKPAEWSEEDKQWLSEVYFAIDHSMYSENERQAMKKYIDSLRSQSKSKPSWSEEDEKILEAFLHKLEVCDLLTNKEVTWAKHWLKSLRPHWKPSEEQMEELWNVISYIKNPGSNFLGVPALIESLYEQLKKLM